MENPRKTITKKGKKNPIKVVYFSNPMKIKTSPSEFRALVQELTGQDAHEFPDPSKFSLSGDDHEFYQLQSNSPSHALKSFVDEVPTRDCCSQAESEEPKKDHIPFEPFVYDDHSDVFAGDMLESFPVGFPPSLLFESPYFDMVGSLDV